MMTCNRCGRENRTVPAGTVDIEPSGDGGVCGGIFKPSDGNADYVTLLSCLNPQRAIVAVMTYDKPDDSYRGKKFSEPLSKRGAEALAQSWAAALGLEVR